MARTIIAPSLIAANFSRLAVQISEVERGGGDWLHLDVMDGHFVPNITFGPMIVEAAKRCTKLPLDTHLMIETPEKYLKAFRLAGSNRLTVHQEACIHLHRTIHQIKELGAKAGVAINPSSPVSLLRNILADVDHIIIMSVNPGFGGQNFIPDSVGKIRELREMINESGRDILIEVDGGVDATNAPLVVEAGANVLVAGTAVFGQPDIAEAIGGLRNSVRHLELKK